MNEHDQEIKLISAKLENGELSIQLDLCPFRKTPEPIAPEDEHPYETAIATAKALGTEHGMTASHWWIQLHIGTSAFGDIHGFARNILHAEAEGEADALLPQNGLSGEWAGDFTSTDLMKAVNEAVGLDPDDASVGAIETDVYTAYEEAFDSVSMEQILQACRKLLGENTSHEWLQSTGEIMMAGQGAIDPDDVDEIFNLVPGAREALQGMDAETLAPLWERVVLSMAGTHTSFSRQEVRVRVANAVRAMEYGERFGAPGNRTRCTIHEAGACPLGCDHAY